MKKNILFLGIIMLLSMATLFAQGGTTGSLTWKIENGTLTINGEGAMRDYGINFPDMVTTAPWGGYHSSFTTVIIERGVTNIGRCAFFGCKAFDSIEIPNSVTKIGINAFTYCMSLQSVVLPYGVTTISISAFSESNLASITLPSSIISVEASAFSATPLASITNLNLVPLAINRDVFGNYVDISACTLKVPISSVSAYQRAEVWKEFNIVGIEVDIKENDPKSGSGEPLVIYPNPTTGTCNIVIPEEFLYESSLTLSVYDASGVLVQQIELHNENEDFSFQLEQKAKGVYVVVLSNGKKNYKGKIVFK